VALAAAAAPDVMFIGTQHSLNPIATMSNGSTASVSANWTIDPPSLGTVLFGRFSAVAAGHATISGEFQGARVSTNTRIIPHVAGTWDAAFRIRECRDSLDFRGLCEGEPLGVLFGFEFEVMQNRDTVTNRLDLFSDLSLEGTGTIATNGQLAMTSLASFNVSDFVFEYRVQNWQSTTLNNVTMTGTFDVVLTAPKFQGEFRWICDMESAVKISGGSVSSVGTVRPGRPARAPRPLY
jgi:hypothetical protein